MMGDYDEETKRVLLLGAGYVSAPVVEYLTRSNDIAVSVGNTRQLSSLKSSESINIRSRFLFAQQVLGFSSRFLTLLLNKPARFLFAL